MKIILSLCMFITTITLGNALKCFVCGGSLKSDCKMGRSEAMVEQKCPKFNNTTSYCIEFTETQDFNPHLFLRGCVVIPNTEKDACQFVAKLRKIADCHFCSTDHCNWKLSNKI